MSSQKSISHSHSCSHSKSKSEHKHDHSHKHERKHDHHDDKHEVCDRKKQTLAHDTVRLDCKTNVRAKVRFPIKIELGQPFCVPNCFQDKSLSQKKICDVHYTFCDATAHFEVKENFKEKLAAKAQVTVFRPQCVDHCRRK